jgi:5-dehydro-4-deoxyglucarate dehydratase
MDPQELKATLSSGLLSFPVTDFDAAGGFRPASYARRLEWLAPYGAKALFAAGGTGELFSLEPGEYAEIVHVAVETCSGRVPILAGAGGPTRTAIAFAQEAERLGAAGLLLFPHYLTEAPLDGVAAHVEAVCRAVRIGVVVYNRSVCRLNADTLARLCERCPTEVYAAAYKAIGVPVYSSAVFNFIPRTALQFHAAVASDDSATQGRLLDEFFLPYLEIRNRRPGYAVSIVKAGARLVGRDAGPVRPPLLDLLPAEVDELDALIRRLGPQ